jgi:hypothetical protein
MHLLAERIGRVVAAKPFDAIDLGDGCRAKDVPEGCKIDRMRAMLKDLGN